MITNERQYRITNAQLNKLKAAFEAFDLKEAAARTGFDVLAKAERDALESQVEDLAEQVNEYEALKSGSVGTLKAQGIEELPSILIKARIASRLSQRKLAEMLGLKEQQIQRYEAENYASASLKRLVDVVGALGLEVSEIAELRGSLASQDVPEDNGSIDWTRFPIREMYRRKWFEDFCKGSGSLDAALKNGEDLVKAYVSRVLRKPTPALLRKHVRSGSAMDRYALLAWQCRVLDLAARCRPENTFRRRAADSEWLKGLVQCSQHEDGPKRAGKYLEDSGINLVIEPHLQHTYLDGAALLLRGRPVIGLTLRYDRLDNFWFTLIHEVIHVIRHIRKGCLEDIYDDLEDLEAVANAMEKETDELTGNALVPDDVWETDLARYLQTQEAISALAAELEISPAIIAGRIRRETNNYMTLTDLVGQGEVRRHFGEVKFGQ